MKAKADFQSTTLGNVRAGDDLTHCSPEHLQHLAALGLVDVPNIAIDRPDDRAGKPRRGKATGPSH